MKTILLNLGVLLICLCTKGQINVGGKPYSFRNQIKAERIIKNKTPIIELAQPDFALLEKEDKWKTSSGRPFRYGKPIQVNVNWNNSGEWIELRNGDRIWKLVIDCPSAKSINLIYDAFWLPDGGLLYLYDKDKTSLIGGLNKRNNRGTREHPAGYATGLIFSDRITLEYYEPKRVKGQGMVSISKVIYGYKDIRSLADGLCAIDINCCPVGDLWQDEKKSVALVLADGGIGGQFTGSLINNTRQDRTPYFLTANHCISPLHDAISNPDASDFIFWWNYEYSGCQDTTFQSSYAQTIGAIVVANDSPSDFALLRLLESPCDLSPQIKVYFNGWDRQYQYGSTVCIHHPQFNPKKIALDEFQPTSGGSNSYYWKTLWDSQVQGNSILYDGSSGSPLYNCKFGRVIGQLKGSGGNCEYQESSFGKISISWNHSTEPRRRLRDWLDPDNSDKTFLDGSYCLPQKNGTRDADVSPIIQCFLSDGNLIVHLEENCHLPYQLTISTPNGAIIHKDKYDRRNLKICDLNLMKNRLYIMSILNKKYKWQLKLVGN